jgi:hypothetical protein
MTKKITISLVALLLMSNLFGQNNSLTEDKSAQDITYKVVDGDTLKLRILYPDKFKKARNTLPSFSFFVEAGTEEQSYSLKTKLSILPQEVWFRY